MNDIEKAIKACNEEIKFYKNELKDPRFKEYLTPEEDYIKGRSEVYCKMQDGIETFKFIKSVLEEKQQRRWIPVSEAFPDIYDKDYLITTNNSDVTTSKFYGFGEERQGFKEYPEGVWEINELEIDVLAWMPLPEIWKEEQG
jgi:hypothetical protein